MKKRFSIIICICLLLSLCAGITYAKYIESLSSLSFSLHVDGTNVPERIEVTKAPDKTDYTHGEDFERDGMEVTVHYTDGTSSVVTNYDVTDGDSLTAGQEEVTISYTENGVTKETTTSVTVTYEIVFNAGAGQFADGESTNAIHCYKDGSLLPGSNSYQEPSRTGCVFAGWYKDADCTAGNEFDPTNVSANGTVYAKWELIDYTITYESNGGSAIPAQVYNVAGDVTLADAPVKEGYTFIGWKLSTATENWSAETYAAGEVLDAGKYGDITLSAQWTANTYSVEYNANGGTGTMKGGSHTYDKADNLADNAFTRPGYTFLGWSTSSTATTPEYTDGQSVSNLTSTNGSTVILYAVWGKTVEITQQPADQTAPLGTTCNFSVTAEGDGLTYEWYYINPGSTTATKSGITSDTYTIKNNTDTTVPNRVVYCVITDAYGNSVTTNQAKIVATYEVNFDANGGTGDMDRATHIYGESKELAANSFTRPGYAFKEWNTAADGSGIPYVDNASVKNLCFETNSITLYAQWERVIPEFAESDTWYKGTTAKSDITSIQILDSYNPDGTEIETWDASSKQNGSLTAYVLADGKSLVIAGNGSGTILANENSSYMFCAQDYGDGTPLFLTLSEITGLGLVDTSRTTDMSYMFNYAGMYAQSFALDISGWDTSKVTNMSWMFLCAGNSATTWDIGDLSEWNTSSVTSMNSMFYSAGYGAEHFTLDLSGWDTGAVTDMRDMFGNAGRNATTWNVGDLSEWDTSKVTDMGGMFFSAGYYAQSFVLDLSEWDTGEVTDMSSMFSWAGADTTTWDIGDLSEWDTGEVTDMSSMFSWAGADTTTWDIGDLSEWDTSKVTDMSYMFQGAGYSVPTWNIVGLNEWDISAVTNMNSMFSQAGYKSQAFTLDLSGWDTFAVTDMGYMFYQAGYSATTWNIVGLNEWDTSKVTNMSSMFAQAGYSATTWDIGDLSEWDTSKVTNMGSMFWEAGYNAEPFALDLSNWDTSNVTNMRDMFSGMRKLKEITVGEKFSFQGKGSTSCVLPTPDPNHITRADGNWYNVDTGEQFIPANVPSNVAATYVAYNDVIPEFAKTSTWYKGTTAKNNITSIQVLDSYTPVGTEIEQWDASSKQNGSLTAYVLADGKTLVIAGNGCGTILANENSSQMFSHKLTSNQFQNVSSITGLELVDTSNVTDMNNMFYNAGFKATTWDVGDLSEWDTSKVTDMNSMFYNAGYKAEPFSLDLSGWDTSKVTNMRGMFENAGYSATTWDVDLSGWDTSKVTNMSWVFYCAGYNAQSFALDVSGWDTSSVIYMNYMFASAGYKATTWDIDDLSRKTVERTDGTSYTAWDTSKVTDMNNMFNYAGYNATTFDIGDLSGWDTSAVANMSNMFSYAGRKAQPFALDLRNWDTSSVTTMSKMFYLAGSNSKVFTVDVSGWDTSAVTNMSNMFYCAGSSATTWDIGDLSRKTVERADGTSYIAWDTSAVTDMSNMFRQAGYNATTWNVGDLSEWDTGAVTNMNSMFAQAGYSATTWDIDDLSRKTVEWADGTSYTAWDTSKVTNMGSMFWEAGYNAEPFSLDLSGWDTSKVTNMGSMFSSAGRNATTWDVVGLSAWDTSSVTSMYGMFYQAGYKAEPFSLDLSEWDTSKVTNMSQMFSSAGYSATTWNIGDLSRKTVERADGTSYTAWDTSKVTNMSQMFLSAGYNAEPFSLDLSGWDTSKVTNMSQMFNYAGRNATTWDVVGLSAWDTSAVTDMNNMFASAGYNATTWDIGDLSRKTVERADGTSYIAWDTSKVTNMSYMFNWAGYNAESFALDLRNWDASAVTNMSFMFRQAGQYATTWDVDLSGWDTSAVTNMSSMFQNAGCNAQSFTLDLSGWDTSKVTDMSYMFSHAGYGSQSFALDLSNWDTSAVTNMGSMFSSAGINATTWDIGNLSRKTVERADGTSYIAWDTSKVTDMSQMFYKAGSKASYTLDLSNWDVGKVTRYSNFNYGAASKVVAPAFGTSAATLSLKRPAAEVTYRNPLTGEIRDSVYTRRPYAVVINNITEALPQHGVNNAAMIYEMLTEGGVTRCLAIYDDISSVGTVGSIRSARTYLVDLAQAYDAILVHAGASSVGANALNATGISHLDALGDSDSYFYRDQARIDAGIAYEHTLFSTGSSIVAYADALGITQYRSAIDYGLQFADAVDLGGSTATNIHIQFSGVKNTSLAYSEAQGLYYAYQNGASYEDGNGGAVTFKNVLVLRAPTSSDAIDLTGSGDGYFACGGQMVQICWQRESASAPFSYTLADGTPITLGVGSSYIAIVPMDASVTHQ